MRLLEEGLHTANIYFPETVRNKPLQFMVEVTCYPAPVRNSTLQLKPFAILLSIDIVVSVKIFFYFFTET